MELRQKSFPGGKDAFEAILSFVRSSPGAWITSCSGSLSTAGEFGEEKGPYRVISLSIQGQTLSAALLTTTCQLIGGPLQKPLYPAAPGLHVVIAVPAPGTGGGSPAVAPPSVPGVLAPHGIPLPPGIPPPPGGGGLPPPPGGTGVPATAGLLPPPVIKEKDSSPSVSEGLDLIQQLQKAGQSACVKDAKKLLGGKKKTKRNFKIPKKKSKKGDGSTPSKKIDPSDIKLNDDELFYEFRKLLLKKPMPAEEEEWFDPKLVQAIQASDKHTGSGYILADQLRDIVEKWVLDQSAFFQLRFLQRHVTAFVIDKFLNRYPKVLYKHLLMDPAIAKMNQVMSKYKEGVNSRLRILAPNASLEDIMPSIKDPANTVVALDFDQTITLVEKKKSESLQKVTKTMSVRGGRKSKKALESMIKKGAKCCIVTAQTPSVETMVSLVQEVRHLGLAKVFNVEPFDPTPVANLLKSWGSNDTMPLEKLTVKLAVLISMNTDRKPTDMERMGYSMLKFEGFSKDHNESKASEGPVVVFTLFGDKENNPSLANTWGAPHRLVGMCANPSDTKAESEVISPHSKKAHLQKTLLASGDFDMCTVRCMYTYVQRTKAIREKFLKDIGAPEIPKVFMEDIIKERDAEKMRRKCNVPPPDETEEQRAERAKAEDAQRYAEEDIRFLRISGTRLVVQYSRYGYCIAARYNKPEAVIDFINKERPNTKHCVFVDDNSDNVWNMFANFANNERLGKPLAPPPPGEVYNHNPTTPVTAFWYTPLKRSEVYNVQCRQLVRELSKMPDPITETKGVETGEIAEIKENHKVPPVEEKK
ncbi:hypothetical protein AAMO2058_000825800 [Amorphochlora amoebiformis]